MVPMIATAPIELISIDFMSLEKGKGGYEHVLVATDSFTKYTWAFPTRNQKASTVAKILWERIFIDSNEKSRAIYKLLKDAMDKTEDDNNDNSCVGKSKIVIKVLPICLYLYVGFFAFFFSGFSVLTTLAFPNAPFKPSSHFKFYTLAFGVSRFLGGSELLFIYRLCPRILPYARIHRLWVLSLLDIAHAVFFIFATWYRFIPNVWIVLALCATHGFISGSVMVNGALKAAEQFEDPVDKGIAIGMIQWGITAGIIAASVVGLFVEPALKTHCQQDLMLGQFCFTRTNYTTGWSHPKC
ncbi:predicted protein [Nematostella vectensis]|uniref:Integrase catalytic domain-containing protein n=1 Tax=Nematostella vectensis TaxID=45351 RepID=A7RQ39_NEMVE|nr:predicted protein [Nematostella vectensis]|eukprot:XP_001638490.1 predicted protein [Nematostella vectensis]